MRACPDLLARVRVHRLWPCARGLHKFCIKPCVSHQVLRSWCGPDKSCAVVRQAWAAHLPGILHGVKQLLRPGIRALVRVVLEGGLMVCSLDLA